MSVGRPPICPTALLAPAEPVESTTPERSTEAAAGDSQRFASAELRRPRHSPLARRRGSGPISGSTRFRQASMERPGRRGPRGTRAGGPPVRVPARYRPADGPAHADPAGFRWASPSWLKATGTIRLSPDPLPGWRRRPSPVAPHHRIRYIKSWVQSGPRPRPAGRRRRVHHACDPQSGSTHPDRTLARAPLVRGRYVHRGRDRGRSAPESRVVSTLIHNPIGLPSPATRGNSRADLDRMFHVKHGGMCAPSHSDQNSGRFTGMPTLRGYRSSKGSTFLSN